MNRARFFLPNIKKLYLLGTNNKVLIILISLNILIRLIGIDRDFWNDELITINTLQNNFLFNPFYYNYTTNLPLYFILFKIWSIFTLDNEILYRFFSITINVITLVTLYSFLIKEFNKKVAIYFSLIYIILPLQIHYSQELRPYILTQLIIILQSLYIYKYYKYKKTKYLNHYTIFTFLSFLTHFSAYFWFIAQWFSFLLFLLIHKNIIIVYKQILPRIILLCIAAITIFLIVNNNPNYINSVEGINIKNKLANGITTTIITEYVTIGIEKIKEVITFYYYYGLYYYQVSPNIQMVFKKVTFAFFAGTIMLNVWELFVKKRFSSFEITTFLAISTLILTLIITYTLEFIGIYPFGGRHIMPYSIALHFLIAYLFSKLANKLSFISSLAIFVMFILAIFHQQCVSYIVLPDSKIPHEQRYSICLNKIHINK